MYEWLTHNYDFLIEMAGMLTGLIAVYLQVKQKIWLWPVYILNVSIYIYIYFHSRLYADMSLMVYYLVVSIYGWYNWLNGRKDNGNEQLPVRKMKSKGLLIMLLVEIVLFTGMALFLTYLTNSNTPIRDALVTSLSFIATWLLAKKYLENWIIWLIADMLSIELYIYKKLYPTTILFIVLTIMAVIGYVSWRKSYIKQQNT